MPMTIMYCILCDRPVEATRRIGGWTYFCGFMTAGLSLLAIPFYRRRCPICMGKALAPIEGADMARLSRPGLGDLEQRLAAAEQQRDSISEELDRVVTERDFYRDLVGNKGRERSEGGGDPV
jgi:hypothetical protein